MKKKKSNRPSFKKNMNQNMINRNIRHAFDKHSEWWVDFDQRGNITHKKTLYRNPELKGKIIEYWVEYNEKGNEIHFKRNDGFEYWCTYNKDNNILHYWDNTGYSEDFSYYNGVAYCETSTGNKIKRIFDKVKDSPLTINNFC